MKKNKQVHIFKFLAVSTLTGLVGLGTFALLTNINIVWDTLFGISTGIVTSDPFWITISEVVSVLFSSSVSFGLNKKFTFTGRRARRKGILLYLLYYLISTGLGALLIIYLN
ncbi:MAG: GtrA family protein, partial [Clostridia bacterium]